MTDVDRSLGTLVGPQLHIHQDGRTTVKFSKCNTEYSVSHPNEGAQVSQTKANQETIAKLGERKLILRAGVEERKKPATGTHQKTDAQILAEGIIKVFTEQLQMDLKKSDVSGCILPKGLRWCYSSSHLGPKAHVCVVM